MVKVKVANPGPAALMVINPKRGKNMTKRRTTRRRSTARRKITSRPPARRNPSTRFRSRTRLHARSSRRRNPARTTGLFAKGLALAAGAALIQFTLGFVPPIGGVSPLADAARTAAVGWGLGSIMGRTGFGRQYADDVTLAGFTLAGGKLISSFILPFANRLFTPAAPPVSDQSQAPAGMQGIAYIDRTMQPFGVYSPGLNGIAAIDPAMQPIGEYL